MDKKVRKSILLIVVSFLALWIGHAFLESLFSSEKTFLQWFITDLTLADLIFRLFMLIIITAVVLFSLPGKYELDILDLNIPDRIAEENESGNAALKNFIHTLRTHLNNILGFTNLLYEKDQDEQTTKTYVSYLQVSKNALINSIDELIESFQKTSKKSSGKQWEYLKDVNWTGKKILVAEDNSMNYTLLKNILNKTHVDVLWAKNGQEAIDQVKRNPDIDMVLMDIIMPVLDGFEATLEIKKIRPELPVIAQTAHSIENEKEVIEQYGFNGVLTKPIWHYELIRKASRYLGKAKESKN